MTIDHENSNHIVAGEGKVFRRISDGAILGHEVWLGYTHYLGGELLPEPLLELPEHFEEIEAPDDTPVILPDDAGDGDPVDLPDDPDGPGAADRPADDPEPSGEPLPPITAGEIRRLQRRVSELTDVASFLITNMMNNN